MSRVLFLMNGSKKKSKHLSLLLDECQSFFQHNFQFIESGQEKELITIAKHFAPKVDIIVVIGGDGTLNEIINGLLQSSLDRLPILSVIPCGTGNDFYQSSGLPKFDFHSFLDKLVHCETRDIDIGKIITEHETRYFINIADIGFGGTVVLSLNRFRKQFGPGFSYGLAILKSFIGYKRPHVSIETEDFFYEGELLLAAVCNGSIFGNGLHIHPKASIFDGQLNLTVLAKVSLLDYLKNVMKVKRGFQIKHPQAFYLKSNHVVLKSTAYTLHAETDGEYLSGKHFEVSIIPKRIKFLVY